MVRTCVHMVRTCVHMVCTCVNMVRTCVNMVRTSVNMCVYTCVHMWSELVYVLTIQTMQKPGEKNKNKVSEVELLREVLLDLLQPVQSVLSLQVNLRVLKMVPNDSPYPKTWGLKKTGL